MGAWYWACPRATCRMGSVVCETEILQAHGQRAPWGLPTGPLPQPAAPGWLPPGLPW